MFQAWITFAPVADYAALYYDTTLASINWLSIIFGLGIPVGFIVTWVLDTFGLRAGVSWCLMYMVLLHIQYHQLNHLLNMQINIPSHVPHAQAPDSNTSLIWLLRAIKNSHLGLPGYWAHNKYCGLHLNVITHCLRHIASPAPVRLR